MFKELPPSRRADQFIARLPDGMREQIARVAAINGRSMNSEIVFRLRMALDGVSAMPAPVQQAVDQRVADEGCTPEDALVKLVLAGQAGRGTVLNLKIAPGTTVKEVRDALTEALRHVPPDSNVVSTKNTG